MVFEQKLATLTVKDQFHMDPGPAIAGERELLTNDLKQEYTHDSEDRYDEESYA
jgi:hypothetical protein